MDKFRIALPDDDWDEVSGHVIGLFGIDLREPNRWCITHLRTGNNLSRMASRNEVDARAAVEILNRHPEIFNHGRFGRDYASSKASWLLEMKRFAQSEEGVRIQELCPVRIL